MLSILSVVLVITSLLVVLQVATRVAVFAVPTTWWVATTPTVGLTPPGTSCAEPGYNTISSAVSAAVAGDTINVCTGTYTEQVTIPVTLTLIGVPYPHHTSPAPIIQPCPTPYNPSTCTMTADASFPTLFNIVTITGSGTVVSFSGFTVTGPVHLPAYNSGDLSAGIMVQAGASATITGNTIDHIHDQPVIPVAAYGLGILVGRGPLSTTGTATISGNTIYDYQRNGITVDGTGSTAMITRNTITGWSAAYQTILGVQIVGNGIQISRGAVATVDSNTVSSNQCPGSLTNADCGPNLLSATQSQARGIFLSNAGAGTKVTNNVFSGNDEGIAELGFGATVSHNTLTNNRYEGIVLQDGTLTADHNTVVGPGNVGIAALAYSVNTVVTLSDNTISDVTASIGAYAGSGLTATILTT